MRVLQVVDSLDPVHGGPPSVVLRMAAAQALAGAEVWLYSIERPGREADIEHTLCGIPGIEHVRRISEICTSRLDRLRGISARAFLRRMHKEFDLVHVHGFWRPSLHAILAESGRGHLPYVITPHGMLARWSLLQKPVRKKIALALAWRKLTQKALFLHALTRAEEEDLTRLGIRSAVEVVPNGFFLEEIGNLPPPGAFLSAHPELEGQRYILFLARLHYVKRVDLLIRAFAKVARSIADIRLVLAGPDCGMQGQLQHLLDGLNLGGRVHLTGPLYGRQKYAAMRDALCFCQSSVYETFSMSILEAMALGVPPVITRECNFDEVEASGAGIVVDGDEDRLAEALLKYCVDGTSRDAAAARARQLVTTKYTWSAVAARMLEAYEQRLRQA